MPQRERGAFDDTQLFERLVYPPAGLLAGSEALGVWRRSREVHGVRWVHGVRQVCWVPSVRWVREILGVRQVCWVQVPQPSLPRPDGVNRAIGDDAVEP